MSFVARSYTLTDVRATRSLYDEWATSYNKAMSTTEEDYVGPTLAAAHVLRALKTSTIDPQAKILDAGCGTGLVGISLAQLGARDLHGVDLSPGMLEVARQTGAYGKLDTADLSGRIERDDGFYDVVVCVGTLTQGHVGPGALDEFVRITRSGGLIVATVLGYIYEESGYKAKIERLAQEGKVELLSDEMEDYRRAAGVKARMVVLKVLA